MGAGKEGAGDGAGKEQAVEEPPQPVVLRMVLHCEGCAKKVRKSIHHMPGVVSVVANTAANTVVVAGTADAAALKARIESKTKKPVEILSAGGGSGSGAPQNKTPPAEPKKNNPDTEKHNSDKGGEELKKDSYKGDKGGASHPPPQTKEEKKQPPEEKKPVQETITPTTALLRIRLHCDSCADRIRRRIYKIKGVKDVILEANAKDEVTVVGTMDVPSMVVYLNGKLNRTVELATSPASKDDGHIKDKSGGDGHVKDKAAAAADAHKGDKGKGIEVAGPSMASAAASMAPATAMANTHHVSPYGYGNVAYPPPPQGPPPGYYNSSFYGGNADGAGYATPYYPQPRADAGSYYQQPRGDSGRYYQDQQRGDAGSYYQQQPSADAGSYYQQQPRADANGGSYYSGGYDQPPNPPPYQAYPFDTAPPPQMFSDENPNSCSVM